MMETIQKNMNEQMKAFADMQSKSLEPMRVFSSLAADAGEKLMRQNHALMGDFLEFAVKQTQTQMPLSLENVSDATAAQLADATAFGKLLGERASEYQEMASEMSQKAQEAAEELVAANKVV